GTPSPELYSLSLHDALPILMKEGHCLGDQALRFCQRHELEPQVVFRSAQLETIQALVLAGVGVSLMPEMACRSERSQHPVYRSLDRKSTRLNSSHVKISYAV